MPHPLRSFNIPSGAQFGARRLSGRGHAGTDYHPKSNKDGDPIYATLDGGRISAKGYGPSPVNGFGYWVKITYPGGLETTNAHMREPSPLPIGTAVGPSTVIGYVGHTGNAVVADPPGSHVHHELRRNGSLIDPFAYYGGTATAGSNITPISIKEEEDDDMYIISDGQAKYLVGGANIVHMSDAEIALFTRLLVDKDGAFNLPQVQMIEGVMRRLQSPLAASSEQVTTSFRQVTDGLDSMVNRDQHSLKVIHEAVSAVKPSTVGGVAIDYDILASKVADKLAARLVS
jgi:hypothetical protein